MENAVSVAVSTSDCGAIIKSAEPAMGASDRALTSESPRLFIVCGRDRNVEQVRGLFASCGVIRQLHLATDRSNKSRGFAFLQYEDPASAAEAIKRLDRTTLSDGHVLKVTVAREKSRPGVGTSTVAKTQPGKLKRNQHSQDDSDEQGGDGSATDGSSFQGKRQRSSPPSTAMVAGLPKLWKPSATPFAKQLVRSPEDAIADVLGGIIAQIERLYEQESEDAADKTVAPAVVPAMPAAAKRKAPTALARPAVEDGEGRTTGGEAHDLVQGAEFCESVRPSKLKSQRTTAAQATPNRPILCTNGRRRVPVDESDSSVDDASDASVGRRKRSTAEPDELGTNVPNSGAHPRRRLSDLSELSLSPAGISSPLNSKKRCSRRSSATSSPSSSLGNFQAVPSFRPVTPIFVPTIAPPPLPVRRRRAGPRAKLFFTSTVKFTLQALEAMFSVYEQFDHVHVIKSFGRVKTMAYVNYATPEAARSVLTSFLEDNEGDDHGMMKLAYADSDEPPSPRYAFPQPPPLFNRHASTAGAKAAAGESTSSEVIASAPAPGLLVETELSPVIPHDNCWLMLLYDRTLPKESISSCATACDGMEFMDIKTYRSTGESQGVAFVKFETEEFAQAASRRLHNSEFPLGSSKSLQAIVIADPSLFSTAHGSASRSMRSAAAQSRGSLHPGEDGDLGVVEARFAHLMSGSSEQLHAGPPAPPSLANAVSLDGAYDDPGQFYLPHRPPPPAEASPGFAPHTGPPPPSPYGFFQFGQPYPYGATHHPPHPFRHQHPPPFYPHGVYNEQSWGYDNMYSTWPGEAGSPMPSDYNEYSWEPATAFPNTNTCAPPAVTSVFVSSSRPLDLSCLMAAIQECPGVVGFSKEARDGLAFVVDFGEPRLAAEAASKLDGTMCNGTKLRVAVASGHRPPPSRRKRQRLDQRGRRK